jgi:flagellar biosynthesis/type III secretory pathway protein FliH
MSDFTPLCAPGSRAFSRAAFLPPEDLARLEEAAAEEEEEWAAEESGLDAAAPGGEAGPAEPAVDSERSFSEEDVDRMRTESFQLGVLEGRQEAELELEHIRVQQKALEELAEGLDGLRKKIHKDISHDVAEMVLFAARRVVGETLAVHPPALIKLVEGAIARLPGDDEVRIRIRPEAEEIVRGALGMRRPFVIEVDEDLEGGCVVEADVGEVEASLEAAFAGLGQAVEDWLEEQR